MSARHLYRVLSVLSLVGIAAFHVWITVAPTGFRGAPVALAVMASLLVMTLKWGPRAPTPLWTAVEHPPQAPRVLLLILSCVAFQFAVTAALQYLQVPLDWKFSTALTLGTWIGLPLLSLATGFVRWPRRTASPRKADLAVVGGVAILLAGAFCYLGAIPLEGAEPQRLPGGLATDAAAVLAAATMEEVVFRVLLLTALVAATGSRFQALVLSSTLFAVVHIPLGLAGPILALDWAGIREVATLLAPGMVWKIGFGFLLGALWLRTGSLVLLGVLHALANFGPVLAGGFIALAN